MNRVNVPSNQPPTLESLAGIGSRLLSMSIDTARDFIEQAAGVLSPALAALPRMPRAMPLMGQGADCCCEIPETECPPRCVCDVTWKGCRSQRLQGTIRVTNTAKVQRAFTLEATPFSGPSATAAEIQVNPPALNLAPGASGNATATFAVPQDMAPGRYTAEVLVRGSWEQCVRVTLEVQGEQSWHCEVAQGDPPVRLRAHRWYDHFQCAEPCAPAVPHTPGTVGTPNEPGPTGNL